MQRTYIADVKDGQQVKIQGFVENLRDGKAMAFLVIKDITGVMQVTVEKEKAPAVAEVVSKLTLDSVRRNIGIVQQDVFLFVGTIRDNIMYGRPDATEEEMIEAAKRANIHDYIMTLPEGYDTQIGERGVRLSGGQKQRLSIARVFLKNPPILILDEATSALDNTTEVLIQQALDELCKGRTTLVVAHRLSTIRNADEIAVVMSGSITERGTHEELMAADGTYKNLYALQFRDNDYVA